MPLQYRGPVPDPLPRSAFGEVSIATPTPKIQVVFPYNFNTEIVTGSTTSSGTIAVSGNMCRVSTGTGTDGMAQFKSVRTLKYNPGQGALVRFTSVFDTPKAGSNQIIGIFDNTDGFAFGYTGTQFSILHRTGSSDIWIPQSSWIIDKFDKTGASGISLNPQTGNVYQIKYQWLGFGQITFGIENRNTGDINTVHRIRYANTYKTTSITNPTLPITARVENYGNNTAIGLSTASLAAFIEGVDQSISLRKSTSATLSASVGTTELPLFTIGNSSTFGGVTNKVTVRIDFASLSTNVNAPTNTVTYRMLLGTSLTGQASYTYTPVSADTSVVNVNTSATGIAGGTPIFAATTTGSGNQIMNLNDYDVLLYPGQKMTLTAVSSAGSNSTATGTLSWKELF